MHHFALLHAITNHMQCILLSHKQFICKSRSSNTCTHVSIYYVHVHVHVHICNTAQFLHTAHCREYWTGLVRSSPRSSSQWRLWGITIRFMITWASWRQWWLVCQSWGGSSYSHSVEHRTSTLPIFQTGELNFHVHCTWQYQVLVQIRIP